jgi:hypothetical protein
MFPLVAAQSVLRNSITVGHLFYDTPKTNNTSILYLGEGWGWKVVSSWNSPMMLLATTTRGAQRKQKQHAKQALLSATSKKKT